ncbi:E3 ubiquitin-protein ligase CIP8-like [Phragmites australis]|uniref:E3 ubiquitin-protein ligase CIP8-like n=1 Tax=Phragmites australis TaxID=29695 RepID=UPI002D76B28E|nr:E3 ubiquitin-protein ligase CIP8-like [Phragmites australis]
MADDSLAHHLLLPLAGGCSDVDGDDHASAATVAFPSFWPPFPSLSSDSDSDGPGFVPPRMDRPRETAASAFFGLGFHDGDDDDWAPPEEEGEVGLPLCWDCLQLEQHDDDHHQRWDEGVTDADEWEQVAGREEEEAAAAAEASAVRSLEWEVLLAANSLGSLVVDDGDDDDDLDGGIETYFVDDSDDLLFGQLDAEADHEPPCKSGRPAAKAAVEGLPTVVVAEADAARGDAQCAVCKDGVEAGERARRLPCAHLYHDGCILPWLAIRNTCPLCRHELPTDDPEYEKWKARLAASGGDADLRGTATGMMASSGFLGEWIGEGGAD